MSKASTVSISAKAAPFLLKDTVGFYGLPIAVVGDSIVVDLSDAITAKVKISTLPNDLQKFEQGDKWYFTETGEFLNAVNVPRVNKPNTTRTSPMRSTSKW